MSMGVYIKGMEKPKNCPSCPFNSRAWYEDSHLCLASNKQIKVNLNTGSDDNCPLVPVPPHGRLIDAGELRELYEEWENDKEAGIDIDKCHVPIPVIRQNIDDAPTVIEAEEGE